jgi:hypothetical protein
MQLFVFSAKLAAFDIDIVAIFLDCSNWDFAIPKRRREAEISLCIEDHSSIETQFSHTYGNRPHSL